MAGLTNEYLSTHMVLFILSTSTQSKQQPTSTASIFSTLILRANPKCLTLNTSRHFQSVVQMDLQCLMIASIHQIGIVICRKPLLSTSCNLSNSLIIQMLRKKVRLFLHPVFLTTGWCLSCKKIKLEAEFLIEASRAKKNLRGKPRSAKNAMLPSARRSNRV